MNLKKLLSFLLIFALLFGFTACSLDQETIDLAADVAEILLEEAGTAETTEGPWEADQPEAPLPEEPIQSEEPAQPEEPAPSEEPAIAEDGTYTTAEDVALYLYTYGHLPENFMTKKEARNLGWEGGGLEPFAPGMCIGGDRFGNYEGILPDAEGRSWTECDIDTLGASSRGAKRIVFSNDGLIYYTDDHYETFTLLYGEP